MSGFGQRKLTSVFSDGIMFLSGVLVTLIVVWSYPTITYPRSNPAPLVSSSSYISSITPAPETAKPNLNLTTFYDDPEFNYSMDKTMKNWDEKRQQWLKSHPSFSGSAERVMIVTGTQPTPCKDPEGDHLLLRLFKNKVDYCRIHGYDIFYNNVLLHQGMFGYWAKYPVVKAAMLAHPEVEWIWWVDSDAVFTDMDFTLPLEKYKNYNLIFYGWPETLYKERSSMGLNAGVFMIRNCQWSMNLLDRWASFGPQTEYYLKWGQIQQAVFSDKIYPTSDDQAALCYMILMEKGIWGDKFYMETEYDFQAYFMAVIDKFDNVSSHYADIERKVPGLKRKHAEKLGEDYRALWKQSLDDAGTPRHLKRSLLTHFTGCEPCSGNHNPVYSDEQCRGAMVRALNFGDSQVLRNFGYTRKNLSNTPVVEPL